MPESAKKQLDLIKEQRDLMKDCTIALMSTSALLLTLVLGFIAQKAAPSEKSYIGIASAAFYFTIGFNVAEFLLLIPLKSVKRINRMTYGVFIAQAAFFIIGLFFIVSAISTLLSLTG